MAIVRVSARVSRWSAAPLLLAAIASNGCSSSSNGTEPGTSPYTLGAVEKVADADQASYIATDGDTIFWSEKSRIAAVDKAGGAVHDVVSSPGISKGQFGFDGGDVVFGERFIGVSRVPEAGGSPTQLVANPDVDSSSLVVANGAAYWSSYADDSAQGPNIMRTTLGSASATDTFVTWKNVLGRFRADGDVLAVVDLEGGLNTLDLANGHAHPFHATSPQSVAITDDALYVASGTWADDYETGDGAVTRVPRDGSTSTALVADLASPSAIAVDAQFVFWADHFDQTISFIPIGGGDAKVLSKGEEVESIAVDDDAVYWTTAKGIFRAPKQQN